MTQTENLESVPEWFNNAFLESALRKGLKMDDLQILEKDIKMAALPGDHYASRLYRCGFKIQSSKLENSTKNISIIIKTTISGMMGEELRKHSVFEKESEILSVTFPAMNEILGEVYPDEGKLAADCYHCEGPPDNMIIMEDLKVKNYKIADRMKGLDMDHATLVLKALGKYHAASLILKERNPDSLDMYADQIWSRKNGHLIENFIVPILSSLVEDIISWENFDQREIFHNKLDKYKNEIVERALDIMEDKSGLRVLLHGDSWVNNFMFKYDSSGKPIQMKFVDFQMASINSPAVDLQYFIFTSAREDLKYTKTDTFLKIYHNSFTETLRRHKFTLSVPYEFEDLKKDFDKRYMWGLLVFCCIYPLFQVPTNETMSSDELIRGEKSQFKSIFQRHNVRKLMTKGFLFFQEKGVI